MALRSPALTPCQLCNRLFYIMDQMSYGQHGPFCSRCLQAVRSSEPLTIAQNTEATSTSGRARIFKILLAAAVVGIILSITVSVLLRVV